MMWGSGMTFAPIAAWFCGVIMGVAALQVLLHPLRVSRRSSDILFDVILVFFCFVGLFPGINELVGIVAALAAVAALLGLSVFASPLVLILAVAVYFLARKRNTSEESRAVQFSLGEMLAMVLAGSSLPWVMAALGLGNPANNMLYMMGLIPLLYLRAWHRLNANKVAYSKLRVAFIALYPYLVFSVLYCSLYLATWMVPVARERMDKSLANFFNAPSAVLFAALALVAACIGLYIASGHTDEQGSFAR